VRSAAAGVGTFCCAVFSNLLTHAIVARHIVELPLRAYTAIVSRANGTTWAGMIEVYELAASER
jgi:hypothetical protein